jgi:DUF1680 family protein
MELALYNSILSGINLDGDKFFYTNPLRASNDFPYELRWNGGRQAYISKSNCCPPNVVRTIAEVSSYFYSHVNNGLYVHLYGGNKLNTIVENGSELSLEQLTSYPWNGVIDLKINKIQQSEFAFFLRIPAWANDAKILVNGVALTNKIEAGKYIEVKRIWKKGDVLSLRLPMEIQLMESNPLVEETRNQVAVKRGPMVYCLESNDLPNTEKINSISIPTNTKWTAKLSKIGNAEIMTLDGMVKLLGKKDWKNSLYQPISTKASTNTKITLIPYFAWANRGQSEMSVWLPLSRTDF